MQDGALENADLAGTVDLTLRRGPHSGGIGEDGGRGWIDLDARLSRAAVDRVPRYMPTLIGEKARAYLVKSLLGGRVTEATMRMHGPLEKLDLRAMPGALAAPNAVSVPERAGRDPRRRQGGRRAPERSAGGRSCDVPRRRQGEGRDLSVRTGPRSRLRRRRPAACRVRRRRSRGPRSRTSTPTSSSTRRDDDLRSLGAGLRLSADRHQGRAAGARRSAPRAARGRQGQAVRCRTCCASSTTARSALDAPLHRDAPRHAATRCSRSRSTCRSTHPRDTEVAGSLQFVGNDLDAERGRSRR